VKADRKGQSARWTPEFGLVNVVLSNDPFDIDAEEFDLHPILGGDGLAGVTGDPFQPASDVGLMLLFRERTVATANDLRGNSPYAAFTAINVDAAVQGIDFTTTNATASRSVEGNTLGSILRFMTTHDAAGDPLFVPTEDNAENFTYTLAPTGLYRTSQGVDGIVSPKGDLLAGIREDGGFFQFVVETIANRRGSQR
jgi:hypothetical protein